MTRCTICDFEIEDPAGLSACPKCGSRSIPCDTAEDVTVKVNWHELRILCIWAEFWAHLHESTSQPDTSMRQTVFSIVRRLEIQHPGMKTPLTLGGAVRELRKEHDLETNIPHEELFDPTRQEGEAH